MTRSVEAQGEAPCDLVSPYEARPQFLALHRRTRRWAIVAAHRRAGKTVAGINELIAGAAKCRLPLPRFAYVAPHADQALDAAWSCLKTYSRFIPRRDIREPERWVELPGSARIRLYDADHPDRLRDLHLDGVVLDEFGAMDPTIWTKVVRPMLSEREGWACFIGTPRGKDGFHRLWTASEGDPDWFRLALKASETGLIGEDALADARKAMSADAYAREYECAFEAEAGA